MAAKNPIISPFRMIHNIFLCIKKGFSVKVAIFCDIPIHRIPKSTLFGHPFGIVIREGTIFGENCIVRQNVTIGTRAGGRKNEGPAIIGNNVDLGAGSIILGDVKIGDNCFIGAGAIVLKDVPPYTTVVGVYK